MTINSKSIRPELKHFGSFTGAFRKAAHSLVNMGCKDALPKIRGNSHEEPAITGYIAEAITNKLRAFDCPGWCGDFSVMENRPEEKEEREGNERLMPDLVIEGKMRGRPEYIFEAKRLRKSGFGAGKYLGKEGLGCFLAGNYAARYDEAGMLGYVQSDSPSDWQSKLKDKINNGKNFPGLISPALDVEIISDFPNEWLTVHRREVPARPISVYYILLDCRSED
ncbi:MAG: hypothetical protein GY765_16015 [bacterium]|nr:hypothetical protein [bacterium]